MPGLRCCGSFSPVAESGGCSRCGVQAAHCSGFSRCGAQALGRGGPCLRLPSSRPLGQKLRRVGLVVPRRVGCSQNRGQACAPCIGGWIPYPWASREARALVLVCGSLAPPASAGQRLSAQQEASAVLSVKLNICRMRIPPSHPHWQQLPCLHLYEHFIDFYAPFFLAHLSLLVFSLFLRQTQAVGCFLTQETKQILRETMHTPPTPTWSGRLY